MNMNCPYGALMTSPKFINPNQSGSTIPARNVRKFGSNMDRQNILNAYNKALIFRNNANANIK